MINELNEVNEIENLEEPEYFEQEMEMPADWEGNIIYIRNAIGDVQTLSIADDMEGIGEVLKNASDY